MKLRPYFLCIAIIFTIALSIRLLYLAQAEQRDPYFYYLRPEADSKFLYDSAQKIITGDFSGNDKLMYTTIIAGISAIAHNDKYSIRFIQAIIGAFQAVLLASVTAFLFGMTAGCICGILVALYAPLIYYEATILVDPFQVFFLSTVFALLVIYETRNSRSLLFLLGLAIGSMAIDRSTILLFVPLYIGIKSITRSNYGASLFISARRQWILYDVPIFMLGIAFPFILAAIVVYVSTGQMSVPSNPLGLHLYRGNAYGASGLYMPIEKLAPVPDHHYLFATLHDISTHPFSWLKLLWRKVEYFFWQYELFNNFNFEFDKMEYALLRYGVSFGMIMPLAIIGMISAWRKYPITRWGILLAASYAAGTILFFITDRYRLPIVALFIPFAAYALVVLPHIFIKGTIRQKVVMGSMLCILYSFTYIPHRITYDYLIRLGSHHLDWNAISAATTAFTQAAQIDPQASEPWYGRAKIALRENDIKRAELAATEGLLRDPENLDLRLLRCQVNSMQNKYEDAQADIAWCLMKAPENPLVHAIHGMMCRMNGNYTEAQHAYEKSIACNSQDPLTYANLGGLLVLSGELQKAESLFLTALTLNQNLFEAHYNLGVLYFGQHRYPEAFRHFKCAQSLHPESPAIAQYIAILKTQLTNISD